MTARTGAKEHLGYAAAIVSVGLLAAAFAILFRSGVHLVFARLFGEPDVLRAFQRLPAAARLLVPAAGGAVAAALSLVSVRRAGGQGVAQILEAVVLGRGRITLGRTLWRAAATFVALTTGGSIGREGPLLQFGAAAGSTAAERFGVGAKRARALMAAGTAAGFAAAYNTPMAAVVFVLEIVTGVIALEALLPVVVATTLSTWLTRLALGSGPLYGARAFSLQSGLELGAYAALGVAAGVVGPAFMQLLAVGSRAFGRLPLPAPARGALGGLVVGLCALRVPEVTGNGYEVIPFFLDARYGPAMLALLLVAKAVATTASVSSGSPGGVFTPSLFLGAATGGLVAAVAGAAVPAHGPVGGYVLVGMAGVIAATTHAPLMATVLGFELSGDYGVVLPLFIATVVATTVARRLRRDSIYTEELRRRGIPWEGSVARRIARGVHARDILEMDPPAVDAAAPVRAALDLLAHSRARVVFVTGGPAIGAIDLHAAGELWAAPVATVDAMTAGSRAAPVPTATPDDSLLDLSQKLFEVDWGELPVIDSTDGGRLVGVVTRRALLAAFDRELLQRDLLITRVVWAEGQTEAADFLELPRGYRVEVIAPPPSAIGRPIAVAALRSESRVIVLGVRAPGARGARPAWIEVEAIEATGGADRWLVVGTPEAIEKLRRQRP